MPSTDPLEIYRLRDGFYATDLITAALVHLDFFSWLEGRQVDAAGICRELGLAARPVDVMLTLFTALGFLDPRDGGYALTPLSRDYLLRSSPWWLGPYYAALKDRPVCLDYVEVLRTGRPANWGGSRGGQDWHKSMEDPVFADSFTAAMDCRGLYLGPAVARAVDLTGRRRLLDVAGGSGVYACALAARHPGLTALVLEKTPVDEVARRAIARRGYTGRVEVAAGDMLREEFPGGCDVHLLSNVLHDWDEPEVRTLLEHSWRALAPGGLVVIHDAHINADKTGPLPVAKYSALLMHSTEGKCYSLGELARLLGGAGFSGMRHIPTAADRSVVTAVKA
ncbi:MAG: hypothetical protein RJA22_1354 [Verrucomicrobiota bacterium]